MCAFRSEPKFVLLTVCRKRPRQRCCSKRRRTLPGMNRNLCGQLRSCVEDCCEQHMWELFTCLANNPATSSFPSPQRLAGSARGMPPPSQPVAEQKEGGRAAESSCQLPRLGACCPAPLLQMQTVLRPWSRHPLQQRHRHRQRSRRQRQWRLTQQQGAAGTVRSAARPFRRRRRRAHESACSARSMNSSTRRRRVGAHESEAHPSAIEVRSD